MLKFFRILFLSTVLATSAKGTLTIYELAALCPNYKTFSTEESVDGWMGMFVRPNEYFPCQAMPVFNEVVAGRAVISVGTERSFIDAALTHASSLYIVDIDPYVHVFSCINALLLSITHTQKGYVEARFGRASFSSVESWKELCATDSHYSHLSEASIEALFEFWHTKINRQWVDFDDVNRASDQIHYFARLDPQPFGNTNYLKDAAMWAHLKQLADNNKIHCIKADFSNESEMKSVLDLLVHHGETIGLVDFSNLFSIGDYCLQHNDGYEQYISTGAVLSVVKLLASASDEYTRVLFTELKVLDAFKKAYPEIDFRDYNPFPSKYHVWQPKSWRYRSTTLIEMLPVDDNDPSSEARCAASIEHFRKVIWMQESQPVEQYCKEKPLPAVDACLRHQDHCNQ